MRYKTRFQISTISAAIASTLISGQATAQQPMLEEVIVTATRRAQSIQDIPINITALSGNLIEQQHLTNLTDIARVVPGMTVVDQGPRSGNTLTVRGLSAGSIQATDQQNDGGGVVATYLGEIPLYIDLKLNDLERVEVLMGPQGTLYGAGTLGGAVRYIPNKPQSDALSYELRGDVYDLSHSSDVGYESGGTLNIPIIEDRLAVRASVDYLDDPGFIDYNYLVREAGVSNPQPDFNDPNDVNANLKKKKDANTQQTWSGRLAVRYTGDVVDSTLTYYYQDMDIGGRQVNQRDSFDTGKYESAMRFEEPNKRKNELLALETVVDLGFADLTSATGYSEYTEQGHRDQTDLLMGLDYTSYAFFPSFSAYTREDADNDIFTQELRLVSNSEGPLSWIVGAFYNNFKLDTLSQEFTPGFDQFLVDEGIGVQLRPDSLEYYEKRKQERKEIAAFGEIGYQFTEAWQVTVGGRWFKFEDDVSAFTSLPLADTVYGGAPQDAILPLSDDSNDADDDDSIYKFNTSYHFTDDIMSYLTISEGYRLGGVNPVSPCPDPLPDRQVVCALPYEELVKSDTTTNYELGLHSQFGDSLLLNGSIYYIEWDDIRLPTRTENGGFGIETNGGSAESYGLELSSQYYITPDFYLMGSYSYNKAELTEDAPFIVDGADGYDGDRLPGTPEHQGFVAANYSMPLSDGSRVAFGWSVSAQSDVITKVGERNFGESLDGFALHYASATWFKDAWTVGLYAENVFDKYAETGVRGDTSDIRTLGNFDSRYYFHNMVRPRQVGLRFKYNFED
jgi:outer membrane receptor protein involved in Fe transport